MAEKLPCEWMSFETVYELVDSITKWRWLIHPWLTVEDVAGLLRSISPARCALPMADERSCADSAVDTHASRPMPLLRLPDKAPQP